MSEMRPVIGLRRVACGLWRVPLAGNSHYATRSLGWPFGLVILLATTACSLAEDLTPPPGLALTQTAAAPTPAVPASMPDAGAGRAIYQQHCAQCHGAGGQGDGPLADQVTGQLPDFTSPAVTRARTPQALFGVITQGRVEQTMPPFGGTLTASERWDVTAYLYMLGASVETLEQGQAVYEGACAGCHGPDGRGDGSAPDFTDPAFFATHAQQDFFEAVTEGLDGAHTFTDILGDDERWAAATYVHSQGYVSGQPQAPPTPGQVAIQGAVTNGTAGAEVPAGLPVVLHVFDQTVEAATYTTTVAGGRYAFPSAPVEAGQFVVVTAEHGGVSYGSEVRQAGGAEAQLNLPLEVFETSIEPGAVRVQSWHIFFDVPRPGLMQVGELMVFANEGDRTLIASRPGAPTVEVRLPPGAQNLQFESDTLDAGGRYVSTGGGFGYTFPLRPGPQAARILFSFDLPLERRSEFAQATSYPVTAVSVLVPEGVLRLSSPQLAGTGPEDVQGTPFTTYTSTEPLPAGTTLAIAVTQASTSRNLIPLAVVALLIAAAGLGLWGLLSRRRPARAPAVVAGHPIDAGHPAHTFVMAIAELDERHEQGELEADEYRQRRAELKARALEVMREETTDDPVGAGRYGG